MSASALHRLVAKIGDCDWTAIDDSDTSMNYKFSHFIFISNKINIVCNVSNVRQGQFCDLFKAFDSVSPGILISNCSTTA